MCWHGKGGWEEAGDGGKGLEVAAAPLSFHCLWFIWCPVEFTTPPPLQGAVVLQVGAPASWVLDLTSFSQLACPLATSKGLISNNKLCPSNRFGHSDYLLFYKLGSSVHPVQISAVVPSDEHSTRFLIHCSEVANEPLSFLCLHTQLDICPTL